MAILNSVQLARLRQHVARKANEKGVPVHWLKAQINAALQAIEDRWEASSTQTVLNDDVETVAPGVFSGAEKRFLLRFWLQQKADSEEGLI